MWCVGQKRSSTYYWVSLWNPAGTGEGNIIDMYDKHLFCGRAVGRVTANRERAVIGYFPPRQSPLTLDWLGNFLQYSRLVLDTNMMYDLWNLQMGDIHGEAIYTLAQYWTLGFIIQWHNNSSLASQDFPQDFWSLIDTIPDVVVTPCWQCHLSPVIFHQENLQNTCHGLTHTDSHWKESNVNISWCFYWPPLLKSSQEGVD